MSHFLEMAGVPTTGISLVREHTEQMRPPRSLWVPFELGRPFGAPHEPAFQRRVLHAVLALLERKDGPVVLEDFPDDAPLAPEDDTTSVWACPVSFPAPVEERPALVATTLAELARLAPWHERWVAERRRASPRAGPLGQERFVELLGRLADGDATLGPVDGFPLQEWVRLGCDDLRTFYGEAARAQPGVATPQTLADWFWRETAAARLIAAAARTLLAHPDPMARALALRGMVPRVHFTELLPGVEPFV